MKKPITVLLALVLALTLMACGSVTPTDLVGTWKSTWEWEGETVTCEIVLHSDGTYTKWKYTKNTYREDGSYTVEGDQVICNGGPERKVIPGMKVIEIGPGGGTTTTIYRISGRKLTNSGHTYSPKK